MFQIDTGAPSRNVFSTDWPDALLQAALDALPEDATQEQIDGQIVMLIMGELRGPKMLKTVRRRFCQLWPLIAPLAEREPEQFDAILLEFAELSTTLG